MLAAAWMSLALVANQRPVFAEPMADFQKEIRPLLEQYCTKCHGANRKKGGVDLARFLDSGAWTEPRAADNAPRLAGADA